MTDNCADGTNLSFSPLDIKSIDTNGQEVHKTINVSVKCDISTEKPNAVPVAGPAKEGIFITGDLYNNTDATEENPVFIGSALNFTVDGKYKTLSWTSKDNDKLKITPKYRLVQCINDTTKYTCDSMGKKICKDGYYPENDCVTSCEPVEGNFTCNRAGEKICDENKTGANCDQCKKHGRRGQDCDICKTGFEGEECDRCAQYYYPPETCSQHCEPVEEKYQCLESGEKSCLGNRTGENCDDCMRSYYGEKCDSFCESSTNYTCDQLGKKICKDNYYPENECQTFCEPNEKYNCSLEGYKVCHDGGNSVKNNCEAVEQKCDTCSEYLVVSRYSSIMYSCLVVT